MRAGPRYAVDRSDVQRDCALYRIYGLDPRTGYTSVCLVYIGETAREPFVRFLEHLYEQPFGDTIVGPPQVDPRLFGSKDEVWAAEQAAVEAERPLYNYEWNLDNPDRIPIPEARRQRAERDRARGLTTPPAPVRRPRRRSGRGTSSTPIRDIGRHWMFSRPALLAYGWLVLAAMAAFLLVADGVARGWDAAEAGAGTATFLYVLAWVGRFARPRRRGGRR